MFSALRVPLQIRAADWRDRRLKSALAERDNQAPPFLPEGLGLQDTRRGQVAPGILQLEADT